MHYSFLMLFLCALRPVFAQHPSNPISLDPMEVQEEQENAENDLRVLGKQELKTFQIPSLSWGLGFFPSVSSPMDTAGEKAGGIRIRGAEARHTDLVVDGVPFDRSVYGGLGDVRSLPVSSFESIKLLTGPSMNGDRHGVGGTLALHSRQGSGPLTAGVDMEGGHDTSGQISSWIQGAHDRGDGYLGLFARQNGRGSSIAPRFGNAVADDVKAQSLHMNTGYQQDGANHWRVIISHHQRQDRLDAMKDGIPRVIDPQMTFSTTRYMARLTRTKTRDFTHDLTFFGDTQRRDLAYLLDSVSSQQWGASYGFSHEGIKDLVVDGGFQSRDRLYDHHGFRRIHHQDHRIHGRLTYDVAPKITVSPGVQIHHDEKNHHAVTQVFKVAYHFTDAVTFFMKEGQGIQHPALHSLYGDGRWYHPNPHLKPETSWTYEGGLSWDMGEEGKIDVSVFHTTIKKFLWYDGVTYQEKNGGTRSLRGFEVAGQMALTRVLSFTGGYVYVHGRDQGPFGLGASPFMPNHRLHGALKMAWSPLFHSFIELRHRGSQKGVFSNPGRNLPPKTLVRAGGSYEASPHLRFFARVENLLDTKREDMYAYGVQGRTFFVGLSLKT